MADTVYLSKTRLTAPLANLTALSNYSVSGIADGVIALVKDTGIFRWSSTETTPDDEVEVIWPSTHPVAGRWVKLTSTIVNYAAYEEYSTGSNVVLTNPCANVISIVMGADNLSVFLPILEVAAINSLQFGQSIMIINNGPSFTLKDSNATTIQIVNYQDILICTPTDKSTTQGSWMVQTIQPVGFSFNGQSALNSTDLLFPYQDYNQLAFTSSGQSWYLANAQLIPANRMNRPLAIYNNGSYAFDIKAVDTSTVIYSSLMPGQTVVLRCVSQLTTNGTWNTDQVFGKSAKTTNAQTGTTYTLTAVDFSGNTLVTVNNASSQTITIPQTSTSKFDAGNYAPVRNIGTGTATFVFEGSDSGTGNTKLAPGATATILKLTAGSPNTYGIAGATTVQAVSFSANFTTGASKTYYISAKLPEVFTLTSVDYIAESAAGTIDFKIDSTGITGGTGLTPSTSLQSATLTANNVNSLGQSLIVATSAGGTNTNLSVTVHGTVNR